MVRFDVKHGVFGVIHKDSSRWASVSLYRGHSSSEFGTPDVEALRFILPHIRRAFRLHFQFSDLKARTHGLEEGLNLLSTGVIFIRAEGEVVVMNSRAEELLRRKDGLMLVRGRIVAELPQESTRLQGIINAAGETGEERGLRAGGTILISRRVGRPLSVTVASLRNSPIGLVPQPSAVIFVTDPDQTLEVPADLLQRCYGLTPAEARLTMKLVEGWTLRQISEMLGLTRNTLKTQLASIFQKTGTSRQSQLMMLLLRISTVLY